MSKVVVMDHPLIQHKIGIMRRTDTGSKDFRTLVSEVAMLECYEATRDLKLTDVEIDTPICHATVKELKGKKLAVVPILRAGLGMVDGMLAMIPAAKVGHIGLYRDPETLEPVEYYCKLPDDCANREVFVVDPMLATGGSSAAAIQMLKDKGVKNIHLMVIIAAPEGVKKMQEAHPDVDIYIGALDDHLNEHGYIVPGLGDAGDRIFGTKSSREIPVFLRGRDMREKRRDYISWDEYFMGVAMLTGMRSKDPNTQVGACIVSADHKILSMGYNGLPTGCSDDEFPWGREGAPLENKYLFTTHSELNAILNYRGGSLEGSTIYVSLFPCNECAKAIIQAGIKRIVYDSDKYDGTPSVVASKRMLKAAGVVMQKYEHTNREITIRL